jgi:alpha-ribazole phosphatase
MKLWLVRHAQPLIAPGICYGATDVPADAAATQQAAQALALVLPQGIRVISSPLQRCEQLTLCLRGLRPDLIHKIDVRLKEMDFGCWEGQRWDDIALHELSQWSANFGHWRFGGVESVQDVMVRVAGLWDDMQGNTMNDAHAEVDGDAVWITHAGVIRAATLLSQGVREVTRAEQWPSEAIAFGQVQAVVALP